MDTNNLTESGQDYSRKVMVGVLSGQSFYDACRKALGNETSKWEENDKGFKELLNLIGCKPEKNSNEFCSAKDLQGISKLQSVYRHTPKECGYWRDKWRELLAGYRKRGVEVNADELRYIRNMGCSEHQQCYLLYNLFVARGMSERTARMLVEEICKVNRMI